MKFFLIVLVFLFHSQVFAASPEEKYFEKKNAYVQKFEKIESLDIKTHDQASDDLEKVLKEIIGPIKVSGITSDWKYGVSTLDKRDIGFNDIDSLRNSYSDQEKWRVTTKEILKGYLKAHPDLPKEMSGLAESNNFYTASSLVDAGASTKFAAIPVSKKQSVSFATASLIMAAQDIGPFLPDFVVVLAVKEEKIFMVSFAIKEELKQIPLCRKAWDEWSEKASAEFDLYVKTNDHKHFEKYQKNEEEAFTAYQKCYANEAKKQSYFPGLMKQAQSMLDRI